MRKNLVVGILKERNPGESRTPLTPADALWLKKRKIDVEVESSSKRIFEDREYEKCRARIVDKFKKASLLVGIKGPHVSDLYKNKVYMVFSHTTKGQKGNLPLLRACIKRGITLVDYEKIADVYGKRLIYFGRFAGICGAVDSLFYLGKKLEWRGIENPFLAIRPANAYSCFKDLKKDMERLANRIRKKGFDKRISPFIIGIIGHGNVSLGVAEILRILNPIEVHPGDMHRFALRQRNIRNRIYKIIFQREEKFRSKNGSRFYFEDYLRYPKRFQSNLDVYIPHLNILIHGGYWDKRYPKLVTKKMVHRLYKRGFRLEFICDISCDIKGAIELTHKTTTVDDPTFTYNPKKKEYVDGYESEGITILARDNLPAELPKDASRDFSALVREYVYQIAAHGAKNVKNHVAIPQEVREAVLVQNKRLIKPYHYLKRYI